MPDGPGVRRRPAVDASTGSNRIAQDPAASADSGSVRQALERQQGSGPASPHASPSRPTSAPAGHTSATVGTGRDGGVWLVSLWALAVLFHLGANPAHLLVLDGAGRVQVVAVAAAVGCVVLAGNGRISDGMSALLAGSVVLGIWLKLPVVGNHEVILGLFSVAVLLVIAAGRLAGRPGRWPAAVAPVGRAVFLVSYGFIALSKLNTGFFDAAVSCAALFADAAAATFGVSGDLPVPATAIAAVVAAVEVAIPVLLVVRRFRPFGVMLGLAFHFVLAIDPVSHVWDFSSVLLPLFLLFAPATHEPLDRLVLATGRRPIGERVVGAAIVVALGAVVLTEAAPVFGALPRWAVAYPLWLAVGGGTTAVAIRAILAARTGTDGGPAQPPPAPPRAPGVRVALVVVVAIGLANGLGPYLEYRTAAAFNMYSNLRVADGESNHLLVPALREEPGELATVVAVDEGSPLRYYRTASLALPVANLDRYLRDHPGENPVVAVGDREPTPARALGLGQPVADEGTLGRWLGTVEHKLTFRRAIPVGSEAACLRAWGPAG